MNAWRGLRHPNVLPFIGTFVQNSTIYMVSPWMSNGDILRYLKNNPEADRLKLLGQIGEGLLYLHTLNPPVVHGDIRGGNILVSQAGDACIADFGLSQRLIQEETPEQSSAWYKAGNPRWQAPELLRATTFKDLNRSASSDMFAYGRVIFEVFTGQVPFAAIEMHPVVVSLVLDKKMPDRPTDPQIIARGLNDLMWEFMKACSHPQASRRPTAQTAVHFMRNPSSFRWKIRMGRLTS